MRVSPVNQHFTVAAYKFIAAPEISYSPNLAARYYILGLDVGVCVCSGTRLVVE